MDDVGRVSGSSTRALGQPPQKDLVVVRERDVAPHGCGCALIAGAAKAMVGRVPYHLDLPGPLREVLGCGIRERRPRDGQARSLQGGFPPAPT